jgi:hypothetical protein
MRTVKISTVEDAGPGIVFVRGQGRFETLYTLLRRQEMITRDGVGTAYGKWTLVGTVRNHDGSLLALSVESPAEAMLLTQTKAQLAISLDREGNFVGRN